MRRNDRLCHHASLLSRKLQRQDRGLTKLFGTELIVRASATPLLAAARALVALIV